MFTIQMCSFTVCFLMKLKLHHIRERVMTLGASKPL